MQPLPHWADRMNQLGKEKTPFLFILDFDTADPIVLPLSEISNHCIRYEIHKGTLPAQRGNVQIPIGVEPVDFDKYAAGFHKVLKAILHGDTYLLNLCYSTRLTGLTSLEHVYENVIAPFKLLLQNKFVVFSPERFVTIENGYISTFPMKGTIDASIENAEEILLQDLKEQQEHATVVDLLRNDLSIVSRKVTLERYRYITEVNAMGKRLLQCSSEIRGQLEEDYLEKLGSIFHALLPAGSVTGAPKKRTVELILEIEPDPRGYYTGVFGVFDGKMVDSAVMIRMIEQRPDGFFYRSGGGITYQSNAKDEYKEMIDKVYIPVK